MRLSETWAFLSAPSQGPEWTGNWGDWAGAAAGVLLLAIVVAIVVLKTKESMDIRNL